MKLKTLFALITIASTIALHAQRGVRIGYIDTEYILQNVPEYAEATSQLESKVQKWKAEIETKLSTIQQKRTELSNEKALLTKELAEEREEDITFEEKEILDYQQKRFGPNGDLMIQKKQLMQPVQDQIFQAVQDIATARKYDFIFDKSADVVMLYSAERFDISDQILRTITRSTKRKQAKSRADKKKAKNESIVSENENANPSIEERQKQIEAKRKEREAAAKAKREALVAERAKKRKDALEARKKQIEDKKKKTLEARAKNKAETTDKSKEN